MSTENNNWIDKVRKELNDYAPDYNASDWKALESKLPATKGWLGLPKQFLNWLKVIVITSAIITAIVLFTQPKTENTNSEVVSQTENIEPSTPFLSEIIEPNTAQPVERKGAEKNEPSKIDISVTSHIPSQNNSVERDLKESRTLPAILEMNETGMQPIPVSEDSVSETQAVDKLISPVQNNSSLIIAPDLTEIDTTQNFRKQESDTPQNSLYNDSKKSNRKNRKTQNQQTGSKNETLKLFKEPLISIPQTSFLIGATYSASFETGMSPYQSKINALNGGLVFEKFISDKSSIALKPRIHTKNFYDKEIIQISDTVTGNAIPGDTLGTAPGEPEITVTETEITHNLDWIYLDFPLIYTRYFVRRDNYRLAFSAGISNKYFLSLKNDGNSVSLNQSFYLAQSGLISFKYQKAWNKNLFLDIEPFVSVPFRKISDEKYKWTSFGVNVSLLFDVSKK